MRGASAVVVGPGAEDNATHGRPAHDGDGNHRPEGLTILAGKPKIGKSWWLLDVCLAVATGDVALHHAPVDRGAVLYLALEDTERRLQTRLERALPDGAGPANLEFATEWPRVDA